MWNRFEHQGKNYDLSHLRGFTTKFERPARNGKAAESFSVNVSFSHHCFTQGLPAHGESYDLSLRFDFNGEKRIFDVRRWELSKQLPSIIAGLPMRKCQQTGRGNYFTVALIAGDGTSVEYDVFFRTWKPRRARLNLHVESAYVRQASYGTSRPNGTAIGFFIILHNTLHKRPIHT